MFNIGGGEFLVIALIALIVLGPQRLPDAARQAGKVLGDLRRLSSGFQEEIKGAFSDSGTTAAVDDSAATSAIAAVSDKPPRRQTPLQAAPAKQAAKKATKTPTKKATAPKRPRPRAGGG